MKNFEEFAKEIAQEAGKIIKENFSPDLKKEWKEDNSPVTEIDLKVNDLIIKSVKENYPEHSVLAEEKSDLSGNSKYVWVCDPVDGTMPLSHAIPTFTFSLALVEDGQPILGIIYDPIMERMLFAEKGKGTYLNGEKTSVSDKKDLKNGAVNIDASGKSIDLNYLEVFKEIREEGMHIFKFNSIIYGGLLVAMGQFVGNIFLKNTVHDAASMKIIIEEAGGKVTDVDGNEQRYDKDINGVIVSNGLIHDKLVKIVSKK